MKRQMINNEQLRLPVRIAAGRNLAPPLACQDRRVFRAAKALVSPGS